MPWEISARAAAFGHVDLIGERRTADGAQVEIDHQVATGIQEVRDALRRVDLASVTLAVAEAERMNREAGLLGDSAAAVAESTPPLSKTTAGVPDID